MVRILVDADACPVIAQALAAGRKRGIPVILAGNSTQNLERHLKVTDPRCAENAQRGFWVDTITVGVGADAADFALVQELSPRDVVVTQDIGLASIVLGRSARAIGVRGRIYSLETIDAALLIRHEEKKLRRHGGRTGGPAAFTEEDRERFTRNLNKLLDQALEDENQEEKLAKVQQEEAMPEESAPASAPAPQPTLIPVAGLEAAAQARDVADVVAWEQRIAAAGTPLLTLMTRAGAALAQAVQQTVPTPDQQPNQQPNQQPTPAPHALILCGSGNNGGDGWACASELLYAGYRITLVTRDPASAITAQPAATAAAQTTSTAAFFPESFTVVVSPSPEELQLLCAQANVLVDCILGTGFAHSSVRAPYDAWIACANSARNQGTPVVSADVPSGLNAQTGQAADTTLRADLTVTMLAVKTGFLLPEAQPYVGSLMLAPLGVTA